MRVGQAWRIKDTEKGPLVWRAKHALVRVKDERGLPEGPFHLLVCSHPFAGEIKYFLSNAAARTSRKRTTIRKLQPRGHPARRPAALRRKHELSL